MKTTRVKNKGRTGTAARTETAKHLTRWERAANEEERALREEHQLTMTEAAKRCKLTRPAASCPAYASKTGMYLQTAIDNHGRLKFPTPASNGNNILDANKQQTLPLPVILDHESSPSRSQPSRHQDL